MTTDASPAPSASGTPLAGPAHADDARLTNEDLAPLAEDGAEAIVLGCAGMADLCAAIGHDIGAPVIDGVTAAVKLAESLVALGLGTAKGGEWARPLPKAYHGLLSGFARI